MKNQKGYGGLALFVFLFLVVTWFINLGQLFSCDFQAPYKCEVVHAVGVGVPPAQVITVFFTSDK